MRGLTRTNDAALNPPPSIDKKIFALFSLRAEVKVVERTGTRDSRLEGERAAARRGGRPRRGEGRETDFGRPSSRWRTTIHQPSGDEMILGANFQWGMPMPSPGEHWPQI